MFEVGKAIARSLADTMPPGSNHWGRQRIGVCPLCGTTGCFEPRREDIANQRQGTRGTAPDNETSAGDNNGNTTSLPNTSVTIPCGGSSGPACRPNSGTRP